eukprot:1835208-Ditylum_brightwellii.AAC.1
MDMAKSAMEALDNTYFQRWLIHILPAQCGIHEEDDASSSSDDEEGDEGGEKETKKRKDINKNKPKT